MAATRMMTNFVLTTGAAKHTRKETGLLDVAFMETNKMFRPMCYCCGEQHPGG